MTKREASQHHRKHGDMHGKVCLLTKCPIHYPVRHMKTQQLGRVITEREWQHEFWREHGYWATKEEFEEWMLDEAEKEVNNG